MANFQPKLRAIEEAATLTQTKLSPLSAAFVPKTTKSVKSSLPKKAPVSVPLPPISNALGMNMLNVMNTTCIMHQQQTTNHALSVQGLQNDYNALLNTYSNLTKMPRPTTNIINQSNNIDLKNMKNSEIIKLDLSLSELLEKNLVEKLISDLCGLEHIQQKLKNAAITIQKVKDIMYSPRVQPKPVIETKSELPKSSTNSGRMHTKLPSEKVPKVDLSKVHAPKSYNPIKKVMTERIENSPSPSPSTVSAKSSSSSSATSIGQTDYFSDVYRSQTLRTTTNRFANNNWKYTSNDSVASSYNPFLDPRNDKLFDKTLREMKELNKVTQHNKGKKSDFKRFGLRDESKATLIKMECGEWLEKNK